MESQLTGNLNSQWLKQDTVYSSPTYVLVKGLQLKMLWEGIAPLCGLPSALCTIPRVRASTGQDSSHILGGNKEGGQKFTPLSFEKVSRC